MCNIGTKCVPDWYQIRIRLVPDWYHNGPRWAANWRQIGIRQKSFSASCPSRHRESWRYLPLLRASRPGASCYLREPLLCARADEARSSAPVPTTHGVTGPLLHTSVRSAVLVPRQRSAQKTQNATVVEFGSRQVRCGGSAENCQAHRVVIC